MLRDESNLIRMQISESYKVGEGSSELIPDMTEHLERLKTLDEIICQTEETTHNLDGVMIYRGNRLVRRLESVFGEDDEIQLGKCAGGHKFNAIVSVFKSRSQTTIDKRDFTEKLIIKKVKEWFRVYSSASHQV